MLGFGAEWNNLGITGSFAEQCPYQGTFANNEFFSISGCSVVPTENDGVPFDGTFCIHWDEDCLQEELMTGSFIQGASTPLKLSRITIASFADMGYNVSYASADPFSVDDLNSEIPGCVCNRRLLEIPTEDHKREQLRKLGKQDMDLAMRVGQRVLSHRSRPSRFARTSSGSVYVGDQLVFVLVKGIDGSIVDVPVTPG